jgi:general secretion pathway protein E
MGIPLAMQPPSFYRGKGCEACLNSGFDRDTQIFEVVEMTDELRSRLSLSLKSEEIRAIIKNQGVTTLRQVAIHKAINGQTSLAEVFRVTPS